jgi:hypothetical protein
MAQTSQTQPFVDCHSPTKCLTSNQSNQLMDLFQLIKAFLKDSINKRKCLRRAQNGGGLRPFKRPATSVYSHRVYVHRQCLLFRMIPKTLTPDPKNEWSETECYGQERANWSINWYWHMCTVWRWHWCAVVEWPSLFNQTTSNSVRSSVRCVLTQGYDPWLDGRLVGALIRAAPEILHPVPSLSTEQTVLAQSQLCELGFEGHSFICTIVLTD